jgi:Maintenance of mitochondrial structure and function
VGVFPKPENCVFVPVPVELRFHDAERSGSKLIISSSRPSVSCKSSLRLVDLLIKTLSSPNSTSTQPVTDLEILEQSIQTVMAMLDRVLEYVRAVLAGEKKGDAAVGRYLMDTLGVSTHDLEKGGFNASLQACLPFPRLLLPMLNSHGTGYIDDLIPREPRPVTSRSIFPISPYICIIMINALMVYTSCVLVLCQAI